MRAAGATLSAAASRAEWQADGPRLSLELSLDATELDACGAGQVAGITARAHSRRERIAWLKRSISDTATTMTITMAEAWL